jgi:hypothetical protein
MCNLLVARSNYFLRLANARRRCILKRQTGVTDRLYLKNSALARYNVDNRLKDISDMLQGRSSRIFRV